MKLHFVGIGGIGISALAQFCGDRGDEISGSEFDAKNPILSILRAKNFKIFLTHEKKNVPENCDAVIFSEAIDEKNPELILAAEKKIPRFSYFEFLGKISENFCTIAIAGTHGKTTTTALAAAGFLAAEFWPTIFVGAQISEFSGQNFLAGKNNFLLLEACEYRENFKFLSPEICVLTSIDFDHPDSFSDEKKYFAAFSNFVKNTKFVIFHETDENVKKILKNFRGQKIAISKKSSEKFTKICGQKNRENAAAAFEISKILKKNFQQKICEKKFISGIENWRGAARRQEFLTKKNGVKFFSDYGHHPAEIRATIQFFREKFPQKKIGLIFEPHQFSRTKKFFREFLASFSAADATGIFPIYAARDSKKDREFRVEKFCEKNAKIQKIENFADVKNFLKKNSPAILIFMGAGKIDFFAREFLQNEF